MFTVGQAVLSAAGWRPLLETPIFHSVVRAALAVHQDGIISGSYGSHVFGTQAEFFFTHIIDPELVQIGIDDYAHQGLTASERLGDLSVFNNGTVEVFGLEGMWALGATVERMSLVDELLTLELYQAHSINEQGYETEQHGPHSQRVVSLDGGFVSAGKRLFIFSPLTQECYIVRSRSEGHQALYPFNTNTSPVLYGFGVPSPSNL